MIPTLRSLPDPQALRDRLRTVYGLAFDSCTLLRSLVNDVYELTGPDGRYVLKLYRANRWEPDEIRWETGLSAHLAAAGLGVPAVRPLLDGTDVGLLATAEGERPFVLSGFVIGTKPKPPFSDELYLGFGRLLASFHDAGDRYRPQFPRRASDLVRQLEIPLEQIRPLLPSAEENLLLALAAAVRNHLAQYSDALSHGLCHGDVSLDNVLITDRGLALHDFDLSAPGYQAADFCGVASTPHWPAFLDGYCERRSVAEADLAAIPYLTVVGSISNLRFHLVDKPLIGGTESRSEGWAAGELTTLHRAAEQLL
ncbi:Ser/Thr protein kinase RdoA (MazF antagonist) [Kribbella amoyensis]|uniref:Ser/Thr protein kinase RdoA (MazF antagonist) n=1 Tax=Kribbella amoyensis TaxID=996641 RepID=A0A561BLH0_9ACTN|nr:phosphotransferase [Kribbella amoyensis]TWD79740.1 Ser/Thr protein kinase RdoA (MazF antagonist) [Kribbella amoyensis]